MVIGIGLFLGLLMLFFKLLIGEDCWLESLLLVVEFFVNGIFVLCKGCFDFCFIGCIVFVN